MDEPRDDEAAFDDFVTARWPALVRTAWLITTDRGLAEDCVQEALTRVHRRWRRVRQEGNPAAYAHRSVVNAALAWRRRRRIREVVQVPSTGSGSANETPVRVEALDATGQVIASVLSQPMVYPVYGN